MQAKVDKRQKRKSTGHILRFWHIFHRISQMDLALEVGVSAKHLSFFETGRSNPKRKLILKIGTSMDF